MPPPDHRQFPLPLPGATPLSRALLFFLLAVALLPAATPPAFAASAARHRRPIQLRRALLPLPTRRAILRILRQPAQRDAHWGLYVTAAQGSASAFSYHGHGYFLPASNLKLLTTATALQRLGPRFTASTAIMSRAAPDAQGVLRGNLYLVGHGDFSLSWRSYPHLHSLNRQQQLAARAARARQAMDALARQVAAHGVHLVRGAIIADASYFQTRRYRPGWEFDDLTWGYGAPVSALTLNDNEMLLHVQPAALPGQPARVTISPACLLYRLSAKVTTAAATDPNAKLRVEHRPGSGLIEVSGAIRAGSPDRWINLAVTHPAAFAAAQLRAALSRQGIVVQGGIRVHHRAPTAAPAFALAEHRSVPLWQDLQLTLKVSQNLHAELALLQLGRVVSPPAALNPAAGSDSPNRTLEQGLAVVRGFLQDAGIAPDEYHMEDGSGLSPVDLVQPAALAQLLRYMAAQPDAPLWKSLLPVGGVDGTLSHRFTLALRGQVIAKTGYLTHVAALSGYVHTRSGRWLVFSLLVNNDPRPGAQVRDVMDKIVALLAGAPSPSHQRP